MRAVCCECPTIVERPKQLRLFLLKVGEQQLQVTVVAMDVMQMYHIRLNLIQFPDHLLGRFFRVESVITQNSGFQCLNPEIPIITAGDSQQVAIRPAAEQNIVFDIIRGQQFTDTNTDFASTTNAAGGINLNNFHGTHPLIDCPFCSCK